MDSHAGASSGGQRRERKREEIAKRREKRRTREDLFLRQRRIKLCNVLDADITVRAAADMPSDVLEASALADRSGAVDDKVGRLTLRRLPIVAEAGDRFLSCLVVRRM